MTTDKQFKDFEIIAAILVVAVLAFSAQYALSETGAAANYRNVTVTTQVNITNSFPEILAININPDPATLNAGGTREVRVNTTIRDFDGFGDIDTVSATFFDANVVNSSSPDDNNNHYTNSSCTVIPGEESGFYANYTCAFQIEYYANNGTAWTVNVTVNDTSDFNDTRTNTSAIDELLALNVTDLIDFGNLAVGEINDPSIEANVTNFGNVQINVTVYGYGNETGDGLAMVCDQRNISIDNERFDLNASTAFASMTAMTTTAQHTGLQLLQRFNDNVGGEIINQTYWRLHVPTSTNPAGRCNGTVVFQAELP